MGTVGPPKELLAAGNEEPEVVVVAEEVTCLAEIGMGETQGNEGDEDGVGGGGKGNDGLSNPRGSAQGEKERNAAEAALGGVQVETERGLRSEREAKLW